jgi:hypothetical protein
MLFMVVTSDKFCYRNLSTLSLMRLAKLRIVLQAQVCRAGYSLLRSPRQALSTVTYYLAYIGHETSAPTCKTPEYQTHYVFY